MEVWAIVFSFMVVLGVTNRTNNLALALILGSILMGVLKGLALNEMASLTWTALKDPMTIQLTAIIILIGILGKVMKDVGLLDLMVESLSQLMKDVRWSLMLIPSLLGLLPVAGGAALSAPLIDKAGDHARLNSNDKASVNLFFRHIWYMIFPLYPSLILAESITGISVYKFAWIHLGPVILSLLVAYKWYFSKRDKTVYIAKASPSKKAVQDFFFSILPVTAVLVLAILFQVSFVLALVVGVVLALAGNMDLNYKSPIRRITAWLTVYKERVVKLIWPGINWRLGSAIVAVMIFQHFVQETAAISILADTMTDLGLPLFPLIIIVSFITGFATGSNIAAIGATFVLFLPMLPPEYTLQYLSLVYVFGLIGYMVSPLHLCLVVTNEYYKTQPGKLLRKTLPPLMTMAAGTIILAWVLINFY